ncbi:pectin acetylesterase-family hydrolase [Candidatus Leptofilum sp.]|uniref:pectin acetylesterase-family hydrolase n=1 Tax=Candidatus Leptofilum sp. TaxID=3241576 RepID=UPI003B593D38
MRATAVSTFLFILILIGCSQPATPTATADPSPTNTPTATADAGVVEIQPTESSADDGILSLADGWTQIEPGGETRCAHDTPFAFWVRPGTVNKLLVYFQGGGGCWNEETCQVGSSFYDSSVGVNDSPERRGGILDFDHPENPFADYHAVYVPSCTGDVYLGSNLQTYSTDDGENIEIYHRGFVNLNAALNWAFENVLAPSSVFVTGCSAGSIGSIRAAPHLIHNYPDAEVVQLGDSLGFVFDEPTAVDSIYGTHQSLPNWIPAFADFDPDAFTMADFYNAVAAFYPQNRFAQYNTEADSVQVRYHLAGGESAETFAPALAEAISAIHLESPNFRSYTADGDIHCIMPGNLFYTREVAGVRFRDWVTDLAAGNEVANIQCESCGVAYGPTGATSEPAWEQIGIMPTPRSENRGVVLNGRFYIPGGWGGESVFEAYNPADDSWETLADLPDGRHHFMIAAFDDKIYLFGGSPANAYAPTDTAWVYDPTSNEWSAIANLPQPRFAGAAVTVGDAIYIVGGKSNTGATPTLRYDSVSDTWTELASLNQASEHVAAVALDGKIYLFGGWEQPGIEFSRLEIYDIATDTWADGGNMQFKRGGLAAAVLAGKIYVVGGELLSTGQTQDHVELYDPATDEWAEAVSLPHSLHGFPLLSYDDALWIIGGSDLAGGEQNRGRILRYQPAE